MIETKQREFKFSKKDFSFLANLVSINTGIVLPDSKFEMVYSRLARRIRKLNLNCFNEYVALLKADDDGNELSHLVEAMTTNLTKFFRESYQFKNFIETVLADAEEKVKRGSEKKLRIWSAACSSGQEPYSISMIIASYLKNYQDWDIKILATDIDRNILSKGERGIYSTEEIQSLPKNFVKLYTSRQDNNLWSIDENLKKMIRFKHLNLLHDWPMQNNFDAIFCRNVIIYFDKATKTKLVDKFSRKLNHGSMLYLGHSEALIEHHPKLKLQGRAAFKKKGVK